MFRFDLNEYIDMKPILYPTCVVPDQIMPKIFKRVYSSFKTFYD